MFCIFFFQAEDGIRDLVRSRGLGDVYKRQRQKPVLYAKDSNGDPYSPAWYTLNFKAMYQFHQHLSVSTGIENLTDQRYRPYSSGLVAPGRNFILSFKAQF
mgnify:CR=1 FL=1